VHLLLARSITVTRFWPEYLEISYAGVTVRHECRRASRVLGEEIRRHHAVTPRTTLAEGSREDPVPARRAGLSVSAVNTAPASLAESLQPTRDVDDRRRLRSADSMTLVVYLRRVVQRWEIERSRCHGTPCRLASELHRHSLRFGRSLNNHFFCNHFPTSDWRQCVCTVPL